MKAFVTGATGFLGIHILQELAREGWDIIAFHRATSDLTDLAKIPRLSYAIGDICDRESLMRGMPEKVDAVFHVAGSVGHLPPSQEKSRYGINRDGTRNVIDACF